jgi:hypothetical protein
MKTHKAQSQETSLKRLQEAVKKANDELANSERIREKNNDVSYNRLLKIRELEETSKRAINDICTLQNLCADKSMQIFELNKKIEQLTDAARIMAKENEGYKRINAIRSKRKFDWMSFLYGSIATTIIVLIAYEIML